MDFHKIKDKFQYFGSKLMKVLQVCNEITEKIPTSEDSFFHKVIKTGAIIENIHKVAFPTDGEIDLYLNKKYKIKRVHSNFMVYLINNSDMSMFDIRHEEWGTYKLINIILPSGERVIFVDHNTTSDIRSKSHLFYVTVNFSFKELLAPTWELYGHNISIDIIKDDFGITSVRFLREQKDTSSITTAAKAKSKQILDLSVGNCYLFSGPPGCGKTSLSYYLANNENKKILKITDKLLCEFAWSDIVLLIEFLGPDIVLLDDFDRTGFARASNDSLEFFTRLHQKLPNILFLLTVNYPKLIEKALLRPGRIDHVIEFEIPDADERKEILLKYSNDDIEATILKTDGLSHALVINFAEQAELYGVDVAEKNVKRLKEYQDAGSEFEGYQENAPTLIRGGYE